MASTKFRTLLVLLLGMVLGVVAHSLVSTTIPPAQAQPAKPAVDLDALSAEIETIKGKLPDQAHAMQDVGYHFSNLWFAGQQEHWDLAEFYWLETRSHLHWAVRIIPVRKNLAGEDIALKDILEGFENGPLKQLHDAITARDKAAFDKTYCTCVESCYSCHKASDKPFIRPQIPTQPESPMIHFDPNARWPQ
jgi:hypothetical protein